MDNFVDVCFPEFPDLSDFQLQYFRWQKKRSERVNVISYHQLPDLKNRIADYIDEFTVEKKECYQNSQRLVTVIRDHRLSYIEGFMMFQGIIPISHGFNALHDKGKVYYFDLTSEIALGKHLPDLSVIKILELNYKQISKLLFEVQYYSSMIPEYYKRYVVTR